jgi:hemerythrin superfamily protein
MADTKLRIQKATQILKEDHAKAREIFDEVEDLGPRAHAVKLQRLMELQRELTIHSRIEEEIFYPAIRERGEGDERARELVTEAIEAHAVVKTLLEELTELTPRDEEFDVKLRLLRDSVLRHADEEEAEMFPLFEELEPQEQDRVSERLRRRRLDLAGEYE